MADDDPTRRVYSDDNAIRRADGDDSPTVRGLAIGSRVFGRYRLDAIAGRGGMGVVWMGYDERLERAVALKFLPEVVAGDAEAVRDLLRETKRCLDLTHPNIVRVHDLVQDGPMAAISMEYVDGESLAKRKVAAPSGCLTLEELGPLIEQLCAALDYAHGVAKVVHRDLKPANILVTTGGQLKVTDFGIARSLSDTHTRLTGRAGNTSGTLLYMSPQQLLGEEPEASDDIYALGATLYELLTGKPPFHTGDVATQIRDVTPKSVNVRLAALGRETVPARWEKTIRACLAKDPENRPKTMAVAARSLSLGGAVNRQNQSSHEQRKPGATAAAQRRGRKLLPQIEPEKTHQADAEVFDSPISEASGSELSSSPTRRIEVVRDEEASEQQPGEIDGDLAPIHEAAPFDTPETQPTTLGDPKYDSRDGMVLAYILSALVLIVIVSLFVK